MDGTAANYRLLLREAYAHRSERHPGYSLRAFARHLGVSPTTVSQILSGKRALGLRTAQKICKRCMFDPERFSAFMQSVYAESLGGSSVKVEDPAYAALSVDQFNVIADWYHYAILSLGQTRQNFADPSYLAARLGISVSETTEAMARLTRLGLIEVVRGRFRQCGKPVTVSSTTGATAIRRFHDQVLERARTSLRDDPVETRDFGAMVMAIDPARLPEARAALQTCRRQIASLLEQGSQTSVYVLSMQLFSLVRGRGD